MMEWSTACPDWEDRILSGRSLVPIPPLFPAEAEAALSFLKELRIVDAPGAPRIGDSCKPWVLDFAAAIFGAYNPETGRRLIQEFFLLVSKKNSKSTVAAAIMLTALLRNWRLSAEFLILAPTIEVADNAFKPARDMVKADPDLSDLLHVQEHIRTITHRQTGATLKVVAADNDTVSGKKATGILVDELWLFGRKANAENMLREATGGLASRPEGFVVYLSTQSDAPPAGVFRQKLNFFRGIRDGRIKDPQSLGVLYEFPPGMVESQAYLDPSKFYVTNPNLGLSVDEPFLRREMTNAKDAGGDSLRGFLAKHLNVEIGMNLRSDRWVGADHWTSAAEPAMGLDDVLERSEVVVVGIDGGGLDDLFGFCVLGREKGTRDWLAWGHAWAHRGVLERRKSIASTLQDFAAAGDVTLYDAPGDDTAQIVDMIGYIRETGLIGGVGVDPAGLGELVDALAEIGVTEESGLLIGVPQGGRLMNAIRTAERKLANGTLRHQGAPMMAWAASNVRIEPLATTIRATKANAGDAKIDPIMALFNAVFLMERNPAPLNAASVYEARGMIEL